MDTSATTGVFQGTAATGKCVETNDNVESKVQDDGTAPKGQVESTTVDITEVIKTITDATVQQVQPEKEQARLSNPKLFYAGDVVLYKEDRKLTEWNPCLGMILEQPQGKNSTNRYDKSLAHEFHVHWNNPNRITKVKASEVALIDRVIYRGHQVENVDGIRGVTRNSETTVVIQISGTNDVVENIPLERLSPISPYVRGQEVLLNGWVGVISGIKRRIWFKPELGPMFSLESYERDGFTRTDPFWGIGVTYPGMRTKMSSSVLKRAKWTTSVLRFFSRWIPVHWIVSWTFSEIKRTEATELEIKWLEIAPGYSGTASALPPQDTVGGQLLKKILIVGVPSRETIGINSVRKIRILPQDNISNYIHWLEGYKKKFVDDLQSKHIQYPIVKAMNAVSPLKEMVASIQETPGRVIYRKNVVTVDWENGVTEKIPAIDIAKICPITDDKEYPSGLTIAHVQNDTSNGDRYGIILESSELAMSHTRKVNVRWIVDGKNDGVRAESVFDLKPHTKYSMYHRGTIVFPRNPTKFRFKSAVITDVDIFEGKMIVIRSLDNLQDEAMPHEVVALPRRCHWNFFTRQWVIDDMIPPPYQLELEYDPAKRMVDVSEQRLDVLMDDPNNPQDKDVFPTLWDEPAFEMLGFAPQTHRYYDSSSSVNFGKGFAKVIEKEIEFLKQKENVTEGIWIRSYENRMDLWSVLMVGPSKTAYEDGLVLFDLQIPANFPARRPATHLVSYTLEIHPLMSYDGNVCIGMIPWDFSKTYEVAPASFILYFLNKLQELLFTPNPYFAHPGTKTEENTELGRIRSEKYNQSVFVRMLDSIWNMLQCPYAPWEKSIRNHFASALPDKIQSIEKWINGNRPDLSSDYDEDFPTYPFSSIPDGLHIALKGRLEAFKKLIKLVPTVEIHSVTDTTADSESQTVGQTQPLQPIQATIVRAESNRRLTPISELTEPSSSSTFGNKLSNLSVSSDDQTDKRNNDSLDSLKNIKQKGKKLDATKEVDETSPEVDKERNSENAAAEV